jgi:hypothetical protein
MKFEQWRRTRERRTVTKGKARVGGGGGTDELGHVNWHGPGSTNLSGTGPGEKRARAQL